MINSRLQTKESSPPAEQAARGAVLLIAPQPFFLNRGTPLNVRALAETLAESGIEVDLLVFPQGEEIEIPGVHIHRCCNWLGFTEVPIGPSYQKAILDVFLFFKAMSLIVRKRYQIFHGIEEGAFMAGVLGLLSRTPYVFDMDSCMQQQLKSSSLRGSHLLAGLVGILERFFVPRSLAVLTVCEALTKKARKLDSAVPVFQIEDFAEPPPPIMERRSAAVRLRAELDIPSDAKVVVYTGNFEQYQGINLLLHSFAIVARQWELAEGTAIRLLLVGGGELNSVAVQKQASQAAKLQIADFVVCTGNRPASEMPGFMELADVLVSPRIEGENTPLKIYRYMAAGRPIVATDIYSHTQVLDEQSAYLAPPEPEAFANALHAALDGSEQATELQLIRSSAASRLAEERFSRRSFEGRVLQMYRSLVSSSAAAR